MSDGAQMDLLTRIEASLEFMNDGGPIGDRVDFVNLREVLEGSREALLKLDEERQYSERMLAAYQEAHRQATENGAAYHALASRLEKCRSALREAMEWNWIDPEGIPEDIVRRCESAAAVERTVTNEETQ